MKTRLLVTGCFLTFFAVASAFGQKVQGIWAEIPFAFSVGSKVLPAGKYFFSVDKFGFGVNLAGESKVFHVPIHARLSGPAELFRDGAIVFDKTGGGHMLSEMWMPGRDGILLRSNPKNYDREVVLFSDLDQTKTVPGKSAYGLTCARCHGPDGKGDKRADKFFNITIPRLSSADVQGMSDAQLRKQITEGDRVMPPVEIDEAGFRHRLPPQDVDAVIAYVRTLKR